MTVKRYPRLIGGEHHGKTVPAWAWLPEQGPTLKLPVALKPVVIVHDDGDTPSSIRPGGPGHQTYDRRTIPLTRGTLKEPIYFECWVAETALRWPDGDVRELVVDDLFARCSS